MNVNKKENVIISVEPGSIAEELGIEPGDVLVSINDKEILDVFDYRYMINDEYLEIVMKDGNGEEYIAEVEKDYDEDIGIVFESGLMDNARSCRNKCIFCFIDQLPKGMRETLYFKDDDTRLSFLAGELCYPHKYERQRHRQNNILFIFLPLIFPSIQLIRSLEK